MESMNKFNLYLSVIEKRHIDLSGLIKGTVSIYFSNLNLLDELR